MKWMIVCLTILLGTTDALAKDFRTVIFKVEQLCCKNCEAKVMKNIPFEKGVKALKCDIPNHQVTVTYDADKTSVEKLQKGFAKFKYTAEFVSETKEEKKKK